VNRSSYNSGY